MDEEEAEIEDYLVDLEEEIDVDKLLESEIGTILTGQSQQQSQLVENCGLTPLDINEAGLVENRKRLHALDSYEGDRSYFLCSDNSSTLSPFGSIQNMSINNTLIDPVDEMDRFIEKRKRLSMIEKQVKNQNPSPSIHDISSNKNNLGTNIQIHLKKDFPVDNNEAGKNLIWEHGQKLFCKKCGGELDVWKPLAAHWYICNGDMKSEERKAEIVEIARTYGKKIEEKDILHSFEEFVDWYRNKLHTEFIQEQGKAKAKPLRTPGSGCLRGVDRLPAPEIETPMNGSRSTGNPVTPFRSAPSAVTPFQSVTSTVATIQSAGTTKSTATPFQRPLDEIMAVGMATLAGISDYFSKMKGEGVDWRQMALNGEAQNNSGETGVSLVGQAIQPQKKLRFQCDPHIQKFVGDKRSYAKKGGANNPYKKPTPAQLYHRQKMKEEHDKRFEHVRKLKQEHWAKHMQFLKEQEKEKLRIRKLKEEEETRRNKEFEDIVKNFATQN